MKRVLYHLTAAWGICAAVLTYVDSRNPNMAFLRSRIGRIYLYALCGLALVSALLASTDAARQGKEKNSSEKG